MCLFDIDQIESTKGFKVYYSCNLSATITTTTTKGSLYLSKILSLNRMYQYRINSSKSSTLICTKSFAVSMRPDGDMLAFERDRESPPSSSPITIKCSRLPSSSPHPNIAFEMSYYPQQQQAPPQGMYSPLSVA